MHIAMQKYTFTPMTKSISRAFYVFKRNLLDIVLYILSGRNDVISRVDQLNGRTNTRLRTNAGSMLAHRLRS